MKKMYFFICIFSLALLSSCGGGSEAANTMADEMCAAMDKYNESDPMTMLDAANAMLEVSKKEDVYGSVSEAQLKKAMEAKCPEGWKKFENMQNPK